MLLAVTGAANLSGGNADDGTRIISYTSYNRNATSMNRLWLIEKVASVTDGIDATVTQDYALAYDPLSHHLHFGADDLSTLSFTVSIYSRQGHLVDTFRAADGYNMDHLPQGLYIVTWKHDGRHHSVKLLTP